MATRVSIDRSLALTVSLKQSPGGEPLCCKINADVLFRGAQHTHKTACSVTAPLYAGTVTVRPFGAYPVIYVTESKVGNAAPRSAVTAGEPAAGRRDNDTTC